MIGLRCLKDGRCAALEVGAEREEAIAKSCLVQAGHAWRLTKDTATSPHLSFRMVVVMQMMTSTLPSLRLKARWRRSRSDTSVINRLPSAQPDHRDEGSVMPRSNSKT